MRVLNEQALEKVVDVLLDMHPSASVEYSYSLGGVVLTVDDTNASEASISDETIIATFAAILHTHWAE